MSVAAGPLLLHTKAQNEIRKTKPNRPYLCAAKPDRDNLEKAVMDVMEGVLYRNDSQIVDGPIKKIRCGDGCWEPGLQVKVVVLDKYDC